MTHPIIEQALHEFTTALRSGAGIEEVTIGLEGLRHMCRGTKVPPELQVLIDEAVSEANVRITNLYVEPNLLGTVRKFNVTGVDGIFLTLKNLMGYARNLVCMPATTASVCICIRCYLPCFDDYKVKPSVLAENHKLNEHLRSMFAPLHWKNVTPLHINCLQAELSRLLTLSDFTEQPINAAIREGYRREINNGGLESDKTILYRSLYRYNFELGRAIASRTITAEQRVNVSPMQIQTETEK